MTGYAHQMYARSLSQFGSPRELSRCGGWILERRIPGGTDLDAMGCYPLFACRDWSQLQTDLAAVVDDLVSLALVADPFGMYNVAYLQECFDVVVPYKQHLVCDLDQPVARFVINHHRYYARKSLKAVDVEVCNDPRQFLDEWMSLYEILIGRHGLRGIKAFSGESFARQLATPGIVALRAVADGVVVGGQLWYVQGNVAYSHLTAFSPQGYALRAAYAIYWFALNYFVGKVRWLDLGAGAGLDMQKNDGLSQFKRGWSSGTRPAYFCGRIFDQRRYAELVQIKGVSATTYFPAYRAGEFA